ncbi:MAG TPA: hypothetical protein VFH78_04850 [Candidatus Thermoplasmatota archaeon]|nr:hypothetical protein [Candidatus Thermoplasmatota archaeon]
MSVVLHRAIRDALEGTPAYHEKGILVSQVLEATHNVAGRESDLYDAVYRLFSAMPARLVRGSVFLVTTQDVEDGVELAWDAREEPRAGYTTGQGLHAAYEADEPIARALRQLETACQMRSGYLRASYEEVSNSSSFPRQPYLHRRVVAHLPMPAGEAAERLRQLRVEQRTPPPTVSVVPARKEKDSSWRGLWPTNPRAPAPLARVGRR